MVWLPFKLSQGEIKDAGSTWSPPSSLSFCCSWKKKLLTRTFCIQSVAVSGSSIMVSWLIFIFLMEGEKHHAIMAKQIYIYSIYLLSGVLIFRYLIYPHWNLPTFGCSCSDTLQNFITRELPQWKLDFGSPLKWPQGPWHLQESPDMLPYSFHFS